MRIPRFGVAFRILAGVLVISGLTLATGMVAVSLFDRFQEGFDQIAHAKLPNLASASQLAQHSGTIAANAPALVAVPSQSVRSAVLERIDDQLRLLEEMVSRLGRHGNDTRMLSGLDVRKTELIESLKILDAKVMERLNASATSDRFADHLIALAERIRASFGRELAGLQHVPADPPSGDPDLSQAQTHLLAWGNEMNRALTVALGALRADQETKVEQRRREFSEAMAAAARHMLDMPTPTADTLRPLYRELESIGLTQPDLFSAHATEIRVQRSIRGSVALSQAVSDRLVAAVSDYFLAVQVDVERRSAAFKQEITDGGHAVIAMAVFSILGALAILLYIDRSVVHRLRGLQAAMAALEAGQPVSIETHGQDEIGDMARTLRFFVAAIQSREEELRRGEQRLRRILEQSPIGVSVIRPDGKVVFANARAAELAGRILPDYIGRPAMSVTPEAALFGRELWENQNSLAAMRDVEVAIKRPDGSRVWALQTLQPTEFEGQPGMLAWSYDITERKCAEQMLRQAKEDAEAGARTKSEFLATMSHEIRTPMNGVLGMLELLALSRLDPEQAALVTTARDSATALLRIIDDILDLSKIEAGKLDLERLDLSPLELVETVAELLARQAHQKRLTVVCDVDPAVPSCVQGDSGRLRQVLFNLVGNAIKFTEHGRVVIRVTLAEAARVENPEGAGLRFEVQDTGVGISAEGQARLFQPFSQADSSTTRRFGGTGLGLAICHRLIDMMGGTIGVDSRPGRGSTFWFQVRLPLGKGAQDGDAIDLTGLSVVIVEPDAAQRWALARSLGHRGIVARTSADGTDALDLVQAAPPDVLILPDRLVDGMTGMELAASAAHRAEAPIPFLLLAEGRPPLDGDGPALHDWLIRPPRRRDVCRKLAELSGRITIPPTATADTALSDIGTIPAAAILVAEDHPTNQQVILRQLRQMGLDAEIRGDGVAALSGWHARPYDLLLTDCHMPGMDGYELARQIRTAEAERATGRRLPIIAMTANALTGELERCTAAGMDDYLAKPVTLKQLAAMLKKWLSHPDATAALPAPDSPSGAAGTSALSGTAGSDDTDLPVLDLGHVRETFGTLDAGTVEMLGFFIESTQPLLDEIDETLAKGDLEAARAAAHAAAGAGRTAGAKRFARACSGLEKAIIGHDDADAIRCHQELGLEFPRVAEAIAALARSPVCEGAP